MAAVSLQGVHKRFGDNHVIRDVSFEVADGEFIVIVGPSGCGKTTLLRLIAGLESPSEGEIRLDGNRVNDTSPDRRGVAMVFQDYALYPHMTVAENMAFGLRMSGASKREQVEKATAVAETLRLTPLLNRKPESLSGGECQRVAIGHAIVRQPRVFLFDEPLSNLDASLRIEMRIELARLHKKLSSTMIYVTHDHVEALTLADKIVVLRAGKVEQIGTPMELYREPTNQFVAGFIGTPRMNLLPGSVVQNDGSWVEIALSSGPGLQLQRAVPDLQVGDPVTIGVRPEHLSATPAHATQSACHTDLQGEVVLVERLGSETIAHVQLPHATNEFQSENHGIIAIRLPGDAKIHEAEKIALHINGEACHLFDAAGSALKLRSLPA